MKWKKEENDVSLLFVRSKCGGVVWRLARQRGDCRPSWKHVEAMREFDCQKKISLICGHPCLKGKVLLHGTLESAKLFESGRARQDRHRRA
jgi:hypothetical protein